MKQAIYRSHEIGRYSDMDAAWRVGNRLAGATYLNFQVTVAPIRGEWVLTVFTTRPHTSKKEFLDMLIGYLAESREGLGWGLGEKGKKHD